MVRHKEAGLKLSENIRRQIGVWGTRENGTWLIPLQLCGSIPVWLLPSHAGESQTQGFKGLCGKGEPVGAKDRAQGLGASLAYMKKPASQHHKERGKEGGGRWREG